MVNARRFPDLSRTAKPTIGVLALQGSFPLHIASLQRCGVETRRVRKPEDLENIQGLVIPGGESTTMENLASRCGLFDALRAAGRNGLPIFGTCAGAILLGKGTERPERLQVVDIEVRRNAYGRQVDSFNAELFLTLSRRPFTESLSARRSSKLDPKTSIVKFSASTKATRCLFETGEYCSQHSIPS